MRVLVTGCYGFIGNRTCQALTEAGHDVIGVDRVGGALSFKEDRVRSAPEGMRFAEVDLANSQQVESLVSATSPDVIAHLAGQYSIAHGADTIRRYVDSNIVSHLNILEAAERFSVSRVVYASSTAVSENRRPSSLYGASLGFREEAAYAYSLRGVECVGIRYGSVYGPMLRRDTDIYQAVAQMLGGRKIRVCKAFKDAKPYVDIETAAAVTVREITCKTFPMSRADSTSRCELAVNHDQHRYMSEILAAVAKHLGITPRYPAGYQPPNRANEALENTIGPFAEWIHREIKR